MNISSIKENIGDGKILKDIYSGTSKCKCGKTIELSELTLGGFGTSLACSCGKRFWALQDDEDATELLVYEGYKYVTDENFIIIKQKVYSKLNWRKSNLLKDKLRTYEDYLYIDFDSKTFLYLDINGRPLKNKGKEFFRNITVAEMVEISKKIEEYCTKNNITPNYGEIVGTLASEYNSPNYGDVLKKAISEYYIENFTKEGLSHLFNYDFLLNSTLLEKEVHINKASTTSSSILGIPKKALSYVKENKLKLADISLLQKFFKNHTYNDFSELFLNNDLDFSLDSLPKISYLLKNGYTASKLRSYATNIIKTEGLSPNAFIFYLHDSLRMIFSTKRF